MCCWDSCRLFEREFLESLDCVGDDLEEVGVRLLRKAGAELGEGLDGLVVAVAVLFRELKRVAAPSAHHGSGRSQVFRREVIQLEPESRESVARVVGVETVSPVMSYGLGQRRAEDGDMVAQNPSLPDSYHGRRKAGL